jgi:DMSO reductase anchor subunit
MFFAMIFGVLMIFVYRYVNKKKHIFNREYIYTLIANILSVVILAKLADEIA